MPDKIHLTVASVIVKDDHYLMVREIDNDQLVINQPAGHVEPGEDIIDAAVRETYEETGWHIKVNSFIGIYSAKSAVTGITYYRLAFAAEALSFDEKVTIDADIEEVVWLTSKDIRSHSGRLRSQSVVDCINDFENGKIFPIEIVRNRL